MKNNKVQGVTPNYENSWGDSVPPRTNNNTYHIIKKSDLDIVVECYGKEHSKLQIKIISFYKVMINWSLNINRTLAPTNFQEG